MKKILKNIKITADFAAEDKELESYIEDVKEAAKCEESDIESISLKLDQNDNVSIDYTIKGVPFERVRRITGSNE